MKIFHSIVVISFAALLWNCTTNSGTEKHQNNRKNILDVKERIQEIEIEDVMIGSIANLYLSDNYLIISDDRANDLLVHLFNRNNYAYISSAIPKGQGPGEITGMGHIGVNEEKRELYVSDHGKLKIFNYPLDSILKDPYYIPDPKIEIIHTQFPSNYEFISDTLCYARIIEPTGNIGHNEAAGIWNMKTGEIKKMKYSHPKVERKRIRFAASMEHGICVECYVNHDLMTIMDLDGNLRYNIYGSNWNNGNKLQNRYFGDIIFRGDKIITSYSGGDWNTNDYYPTKLLIFHVNGDYIKTLDIGYRINHFVYDSQNDRLIFNFEDMIQFGYLPLTDDLIE